MGWRFVRLLWLCMKMKVEEGFGSSRRSFGVWVGLYSGVGVVSGKWVVGGKWVWVVGWNGSYVSYEWWWTAVGV